MRYLYLNYYGVLTPFQNRRVLTRHIMSPVNFKILLMGSILVIYYYFFFFFFTIPFAFLWVVSNKLFGTYYMSEAIVSIAIMQYKQSSFYPISGLSAQTCKLGFFFSYYVVLFVILFEGCFYLAQKKRGKRDVSNNKLFQILYTKGRIVCKLLNAIFYCGKSTIITILLIVFCLHLHPIAKTLS